MTIDTTAIRAWIGALYARTPGLIHVSSTGNWTGRAFDDHDQAAAYIAQLDTQQPEGIYLRATTLRQQPAAGQRAGAADSRALPGLWADLDIAGPGHKHELCPDDCPKGHQHKTRPLPPDADAARSIITTSDLPEPTLWVHSGGGLYPWWLLEHGIEVHDGNLEQLAQLSARWQKMIGRAATALGYEYGTGVGDLARVLRAPGTTNRKAGQERPCTVIEANRTRYSLTQLEAGLAAALQRHPDPAPRPAPAARSTAPGQRRLEVVRAPGETSPGDDFEARVDWDDKLLLGDWTIARGTPGAYCEWIRPGKDTEGISATTGHDPARDRLKVFTDASDFQQGGVYTKFGAYAVMHHAGDHRAAAKELRRLNYGTPPPEPIRHAATLGIPAPADPAVNGTAVRAIDHSRAPLPQYYGATQDGMAIALVEHHGDEIRYVPEREKWLAWNGHQWAWDDAAHHRELAKQIGRQLPVDKEWKDFRRSCLSAAGTGGIITQARSDARIVAPFNALDADGWNLNTPGGIVNMRTGTLRPSDPTALCTRSTAVPYDADADQGRWQEFLRDTFGDDQDLISYLQRLVGYSAVGVVGPHVLPFAHGSGGNGKGVFLEALAGVLGDYATTSPNGFLMSTPFPGHETELARLAGARMVICSEVNEDDRFDEAKVKALTGGDSITARFMRQDHFTFRPTHQLWLMGNHQPAVRSGGRSFWRRLRLIPFEHEVPEEKIVDDLQGRLIRDHGPALLAWLVQGAVDYAKHGLKEPEKVKAATQEYAHDQDSVVRFVEEMCRVGGGDLVTIKIGKVREEYEAFCASEGMKAVTAKKLTMDLERRYDVRSTRTRSARLYTNLSLLSAAEDDEPEPAGGDW